MTCAVHRLARVSRTSLLWLALALWAAHSVATWHPYSHAPAQAATAGGKRHVDLADCGLCLAGTANMGGAPPMDLAALLPQAAPDSPQPVRMAFAHPAPARQPYAIRAPPAQAA